MDRTAALTFIVGAPRSGTTLVQRLLEPVLAIGPETHYIRRFWLRRRRYGSLSNDSGWERLLRDIAATPEFGDSDISVEQLRRANRTHRDVLEHWIRCHAAGRGQVRAGEKTPNHALAIGLLATWYPDARFVHVVRDPRDVATSTASTPWSTGSRSGDANVWRQYVRAVRRSTANERGRVHTVFYEALTTDPERVLGPMCAFLDLDVDPTMVDLASRPPSGLDVGREPWKASTLSAPTTASVGRWLVELAPSDVAAVEAVTASEMTRWGYEPATTPRARLRAGVPSLPQLAALQTAALARRVRL
ncbi:MAG: sulfotransferase [Acidimicrobiales bacterium]|nr:sulfotransferase [Acidimicrobiales bacterium]